MDIFLHCLFIFWMVGCVITAIVACIEAYYSEKRGENIDEFCNMICPIIMLSWIYLIMSRKRLMKLFFEAE